MPQQIAFGPEFAFNCLPERRCIGMKNTMKKRRPKMAGGLAHPCVRHDNNAQAPAYSFHSLQSHKEDVCHV